MQEAEALGDLKLRTREDVAEGSRALYEMFGCSVLLKGGHLQERAVDVLMDREGKQVYESEMVSGVNNHGSGCTLASAIAASLARGQSLRDAIGSAKTFILASLKESWPLGEELNVMNHFSG